MNKILRALKVMFEFHWLSYVLNLITEFSLYYIAEFLKNSFLVYDLSDDMFKITWNELFWLLANC